ncbi:hypothetical protein PENTCL1PPCAC_4534, partial [Pristionchus entomophagus]
SRSLARHHLDEICKNDVAGAVVGHRDHLVDLLLAQRLAHRGEDGAQVGRVHVALALLVEHPEGGAQLLLGVGSLILRGDVHHGEEGVEVDGVLAFGIDHHDEVGDLRLGGVEAELKHHLADVGGRDEAVAVGVEQRERLLELGDVVVFRERFHWWR